MRSHPRLPLFVLLLAVVGAGLLFLPPGRAQDDPHADRAARESARVFATGCASCHVYPDASLPTDRAWLGQVLETS